MLKGKGNRLFSIGSFNNDVETSPFKQVPQTSADKLVVVGEHESQRHRRLKDFPILRPVGSF